MVNARETARVGLPPIQFSCPAQDTFAPHPSSASGVRISLAPQSYSGHIVTSLGSSEIQSHLLLGRNTVDFASYVANNTLKHETKRVQKILGINESMSLLKVKKKKNERDRIITIGHHLMWKITLNPGHFCSSLLQVVLTSNWLKLDKKIL